jgi:hypothetical protein
VFDKKKQQHKKKEKPFSEKISTHYWDVDTHVGTFMFLVKHLPYL